MSARGDMVTRLADQDTVKKHSQDTKKAKGETCPINPLPQQRSLKWPYVFICTSSGQPSHVRAHRQSYPPLHPLLNQVRHARETQLTTKCHSAVRNAAHISKLSEHFSDSVTASRCRYDREQPAHETQTTGGRCFTVLSPVYSMFLQYTARQS